MNKLYFAIVLSVFIAGCSSENKKAEASTKPQAVVVQTVAARAQVLDRTLPVTGSLLPDETVSVSAEVPGRITAIYVDFGQDVRKGQVLAELDKQELSLAVERSKAALAQVLARLGLEPSQVNVRPDSTPAVRQALAQMEDARNKYESASSLVKTGDISNERFTEVEKMYQMRKAAVEAARDEVLTLLAQVQALKTEVALAQKRLGDATLRAPFDGSVSQKLQSPGAFIKENTPVLTLVKTNPLRLRLDVPESAAGVVRPGTTLTFSTDAAPGVQFNAVVRELNPSLDAKSRTLTAEARLTNGNPRLRPGMFVQVQLVVAKGSEAVLVPKRAIYRVAGLTKVFTVQGGKAVEHKVNTGQEVGDWVEVPREAVNPGDSVAVSALTQLIDGLPVSASAPRS